MGGGHWGLTAGLEKGQDVAAGSSQLGNTGLGYSLNEPVGVDGTPTSHAWLPRDFSTLPSMVAPGLEVSARLGQVHAGMEKGCDPDLGPGVWRNYQLQKRH